MSWASNNRWENSSRSIITSETSFAHTRAIVYNQSGNFVVTHFELGLACNSKKTNVNWGVLVLHIRKGLRVKVNVCTILESPEGGRCGCSKNLSPMKPIRATEGTEYYYYYMHAGSQAHIERIRRKAHLWLMRWACHGLPRFYDALMAWLKKLPPLSYDQFSQSLLYCCF